MDQLSSFWFLWIDDVRSYTNDYKVGRKKTKLYFFNRSSILSHYSHLAVENNLVTFMYSSQLHFKCFFCVNIQSDFAYYYLSYSQLCLPVFSFPYSWSCFCFTGFKVLLAGSGRKRGSLLMWIVYGVTAQRLVHSLSLISCPDTNAVQLLMSIVESLDMEDVQHWLLCVSW